jgi:AcrR family transcriptional regulator
MDTYFTWRSPSSRLVLQAVLDTLLDLGYDGLTVEEIKARAGGAGEALPDDTDLDALLVAALDLLTVFGEQHPTGDLRHDLHLLLRPWRGPATREELIVGALLSAAHLHPRLKEALADVVDRPLNQIVGATVAQATQRGHVPVDVAQTLSWILRALQIDRLRSGPRSQVDLDRLVAFLINGVAGSIAHRDASATPENPRPHDGRAAP